MNRARPGIRELLAAANVQQAEPHVKADDQEAEPQPAPPPPEQTDPLPQPGDPYTAYGRWPTKPIETLFLVTAGFEFEGFTYAYLERIRLVSSDKPGGGMVLVLKFSGSSISEVKIEGRHLHMLRDLIGRHVMPWVWELPTGNNFKDPAKPVITKISIDEK